MMFSMPIYNFSAHTHTHTHTHTSGSNLTVSTSTSGTSVVELITFAALSWGSVVSFVFIGFILSCLTWARCKQFLMDSVTLKIHLECFSQVIYLVLVPTLNKAQAINVVTI